MRHFERLLDRLQFFQKCAQIACVARIGAVAFRLLGIVMDFHEHTVDTGRDRRA